MTCVLSMTALYCNNPCSKFQDGGGGGRKPTVCEEFGYSWISTSPKLGGTEIHSPPTTCREQAVSPTPSGKLLPGGSDSAATCTGGVLGVRGEAMCNITQDPDSANKGPRLHGVKRKLGSCHYSSDSDSEEMVNYVPPKRISPFLNTPKERKEERKKILKISIQKLRQLDDPEQFLRRSVLINNTMKKMQVELRQEKQSQSRGGLCNVYKLRPHCGYDVLNNSCLSSSYLFEDPFLCGENEKITDDMTDTLMHSLETRLGGSIGSLSGEKEKTTAGSGLAGKHAGDNTNSSSAVVVQQDVLSNDSCTNSNFKSSTQLTHSELGSSCVELRFDHHSLLSDTPPDPTKSVEAVFNNLIRALGET